MKYWRKSSIGWVVRMKRGKGLWEVEGRGKAGGRTLKRKVVEKIVESTEKLGRDGEGEGRGE